MRVAGIQMDCAPGDPEGNTARMLDFIDKAASIGADLIVFPEMADTGYDMQIILRTASTWESGPLERLRAAAQRHGVNIVAGLSERVGGEVYNAVAVIDRRGELAGKYRKTHLITADPMREHEHLKAGDALGFVEIDGEPIGLMTCYDIRFPEVARSLALKGARILVVPAAWPVTRIPHWACLTGARAIENQVFLIGVGRVGAEAGSIFGGSSVIYNPYGVVLGSASQVHESIVFATLDMAEIDLVRGQIRVHQDRRPALYHGLV